MTTLMLRVQTDDEVLVWRCGVHTDRRRQMFAVERRNAMGDGGAHGGDLGRMHGTINGIGVARFTGAEERNLDAAGRSFLVGKAVELRAVFRFPDIDRKAVGQKRLNAALRRKPVERLSLHHQRRAEIRQQTRRPRTGRNDQAFGGIAVARRCYRHSTCVSFPCQRRLLEAQVGAERSGALQVRGDAGFGTDEASLVFIQCDGSLRRTEQRKTAPDRGGIEQFVLQPVFLRAAQRPGDGVTLRGPIINPPVTVNRCAPLSCSICRHRS